VSRKHAPPPGPGGLVIVDKPGGMTSHDVVARVRRLADTRRVGHAGTLDPMATGVLVLGVERATRLLGYLVLTDKAYAATIRLGRSTLTDDAEGEVTGGATAAAVEADRVRAGLAALTGEIDQVPSAVSAVKVAGERAYARVRAGESVELAARRVTVSRLDLVGVRRPEPDLLDCDVEVDCSAGTYVRALARDLGAALGVGGHLTALRRTRVGPFGVDAAVPLPELERRAASPAVPGAGVLTHPLDAAVRMAFATRQVDEGEARMLAHGRRLPAVGIGGTYGVFGPDGSVIALVAEERGEARPVLVLAPAQ
jgi:tRNA pseudouridine55 synthase